MDDAIRKYIDEVIKTYKTGHAREHAYRPALEILVEEINTNINAVNDPKQQKVGAPDFVLLKGKTPIGYIEAKDIDVDLDKEFKTKNQFHRYKASLNNLCFTNYLEFIFFVNGQEVQRVAIGKLVNGKIEVLQENVPLLASLLKNFTQQKAITIRSARELASLMAEKAKMLKNVVYLSLKEGSEEKGQVEKQYEVFKQMLIHDLSLEQYADIYAQTVAYGMFAARYHDNSLDTFTRDEANNLLPKSNPFLRNFFQTIAGYNIDERIVWIVDDLAELFNHVNVRELLEHYGKDTKRSDVIVHFYETFLAEYDPKMRKSRGVYYTPEPVVDFIVRAVDDILKAEFGIADGLADIEKIDVEKSTISSKKKQKIKEHRVQILDPATGTGTFLDHTIKHIYNTRFKGQTGLWQTYVDEHLLPRLHGFEILMASYSMAHLKLDITLAETGYDFKKGSGKRLGVYLTNSLEEPAPHQRDLFSQWLTEESLEANEVKNEKPIMVVMGNPPYSISSSNKGEWIQNLIKDYKKDLNEKKINLDDDYIKFIRFAQWFVEKNGEGIIAFISNNSFIDGITHRQMRKSLLQTFNKIYILNLHGNAKKKEVTPEGMKDENVFDIMQGVSINIFVKKSNTKKGELGEIFYKDMWGLRNNKYSLLNNGFNGGNFKKISYKEPLYFYKSFNYSIYDEYYSFIPLNKLFVECNSGVQTKNDLLTIKWTTEEINHIVNSFKTLSKEELIRTLNIKDSAGWKIDLAIQDINNNKGKFVEIQYRLFDKRITYFTGKSSGFIGRTRGKVMEDMLKPNIGLVFKRTGKLYGPSYDFAFVTKNIISEGLFAIDPLGREYIAPLYLYPENGGIDRTSLISNFNKKLIDLFSKKIKLKYIVNDLSSEINNTDTFTDQNFFDYIYSILYSNSYRDRYRDFLMVDFPRIPFTSDKKLFWELVQRGQELRKYHLIEDIQNNSFITQYTIGGENEVIIPRYSDNKVWINETQYFDGVPETAWNFYIGGYQPAQKWLKDRKGRKLTFEDVIHYQRIIVALVNTERIMKEIDGLIPSWPLK